MRCHRYLFLFAIAPAWAQSSLSGPSLGMVFDASVKGVRPIWGIPGASTLGQPLALGFAVSLAAVSPVQSYALVWSEDNGALSTVQLKDGAVNVSAVSGISTAPARIALSPNGAFAALYFKDQNAVQIISGLPSGAATGPRIDLSGLPAALTNLVINDAGDKVLASLDQGGTPETRQSSLYLLTPADNSARVVLTSPHLADIAFLSKSDDAAFADDQENSVSVLRDVANTAARTVLISGDQVLQKPAAVQALSGNQQVLAGSSQGGAVAVLDLAGAPPFFLSCRCSPTSVHRLSASSVFQLTEPKDGLLWILDWDPDSPRILFVPPETDSSSSSSGGAAQ